jgi:hypothetical protein
VLFRPFYLADCIGKVWLGFLTEGHPLALAGHLALRRISISSVLSAKAHITMHWTW